MKNIIGKIRLFIFIVTIVILNTANARILNVPQDYSTIAAAVLSAQDGDVILLQDGVYRGTGNKNISYRGKAISIRSMSGPHRCIIDCEGSGSGFIFEEGETETSSLHGITIRMGNSYRGGGIYCYYSSPSINSCIFEQNVASDKGGACYMLYESEPVLFNCLFVANEAISGGGIYTEYYSHVKLFNCTFTENVAVSGGAITAEQGSALTLTNCILYGDTPDELMTSTVAPSITYSDIEGGFEGTGNIDADPLFVLGPYGTNYLSQISAGQPDISPCLDAGSATATTVCYDIDWGSVCLSSLTTRTDEMSDDGKVDMGFHYFPHAFATPTPSPTDIPTLTATPQPSPTPTCTNTPHPTQPPMYTPIPFMLSLKMPDTYYSPGDPCWLSLDFTNNGSELYNQYLFIILDINGQYWFYPDWSTEVDYMLVSIAKGDSGLIAIPGFYWPDTGQMAMSDLYFWSFILEPDFNRIVGDDYGLDRWIFGFGP